jgi:hypothetical protein
MTQLDRRIKASMAPIIDDLASFASAQKKVKLHNFPCNKV